MRRRDVNVENNAFSSEADLAQASMCIATAINISSSAEKRANTHPLLYARRYPVQFCFCVHRSLSDSSLPLSLLLVYRYPRLKTIPSILTRSITTEATCQTWATLSLFHTSSIELIRFIAPQREGSFESKAARCKVVQRHVKLFILKFYSTEWRETRLKRI